MIIHATFYTNALEMFFDPQTLYRLPRERLLYPNTTLAQQNNSLAHHP
jgi:hypothetical protein